MNRRFQRPAFCYLVCPALAAFSLASPALAQNVTLTFADTGITERALQLVALLTVLSLAPSILLMTTSFTRIVVVLSLLRTAIGAGTAPPNAVMIALALFLSLFVMGPTLTQAYDAGIRPFLANEITADVAFERGSRPIHEFMMRNTREKDLRLFLELSREPTPQTPQDVSLRVLAPSFMISELRRAFEIGFLLFLPFMVIDLVVASVLTALGMTLLPPASISLPFKLIFFVLVDGWNLIAGSLVQSFGTGT